MKSPRVLVVLGTRPEVIKLAPVIHALRRSRLKVSVCDTGQHRDLNRPLLKWFRLEPDHRLDLMTEAQGLEQLSAKAFGEIGALLARTQPDLVVCQGDTTTAMAAGMCAFYRRIPLAHVEAGLRTGDRAAPFPEELNRRILGQLADLHFAPTRGAALALRQERIPASAISVTGNTSIDALLWTVGRARARSQREEIERGMNAGIRKVFRGDDPFVLVTIHRRESFGKRIRRLGSAIAVLARKHSDWRWVVPLHPNPEAGPILAGALRGLANVELGPPLGYPQFCALERKCRFLISDSGGVQEEAPALGKPVLVAREKTERPEALRTGHLALTGYDAAKLTAAAERFIGDPRRLARFRPVFPYGDGKASERIAARIVEFLKDLA